MDFIEKANLQNSTLVSTPFKVNVKLGKDDEELLLDPTMYRHLVGSLVYLTITKLDLSYAINFIRQFMSTPRHLHLAIVRRIIQYLQGTLNHGLYFPARNPLTLLAYS